MSNPFDKHIASNKLQSPVLVIILMLFLALAGFALTKAGLMAAGAFIALPVVFFFLVWIFYDPRNGVIAYIFATFLISGIGRYITNIPIGLSADGLLTLTLLSLIFKNFHKGVDWRPANHPLTWIIIGWFTYTLLQIFNPEARSMAAWFYAMRGVALYPLLTIPLVFLLFNKHKDLKLFLKIWAVITILGGLKAIQQKYIGLDPFEQRWLDAGGHVTHLLFGKLRAFSFYSDAGTFGAAMGQAMMVFAAAGLDAPKRNNKILYFAAAAAGFIGLMLSGTRGAMAVPGAGILIYLFLKKNMRLFALGIIGVIMVFSFLKFTTIGNGVYEINRMRTALDPQDASLQVRIRNQQKLKAYLKTRPFGGGVGSAGNWGLRFSPNTFLAQTPTDSWYVRIWAEMGIVGLLFHIGMLSYILIAGSRIIYVKVNNKELNGIMAGFLGGYFGIMVASYGNEVFGQHPIGPTIYIGTVFVFLAPKIQKEMEKSNQKDKQLKELNTKNPPKQDPGKSK